MKNFSDIKHRIKSISDTLKITSAMETISVAKMRKAINRCDNNRNYFNAIVNAVNDIKRHIGNISHKIFDNGDNKQSAYLIIASDKGLAGGFNHNILAFAQSELSQCKETYIYAVGKVCEEFFCARNVNVDSSFIDAGFEPSVSRSAEIAERLYAMFSTDAVDSVYVIYNNYDEHGKTSLCKTKLLPFGRENDNTVKSKFEFEMEPSAAEVLDVLVPQCLTGIIYGALVQSCASEHSQRRNAMNSATKNARELLEDLRIDYNRARQESVTDELNEIVTAASGVQYDD